jgi:hypothetical protein
MRLDLHTLWTRFTNQQMRELLHELLKEMIFSLKFCSKWSEPFLFKDVHKTRHISDGLDKDEWEQLSVQQNLLRPEDHAIQLAQRFGNRKARRLATKRALMCGNAIFEAASYVGTLLDRMNEILSNWMRSSIVDNEICVLISRILDLLKVLLARFKKAFQPLYYVIMFFFVFSEFPDSIRPPCTTMPWSIWPALVVLWGVCWMFVYPPQQVDVPCAPAAPYSESRDVRLEVSNPFLTRNCEFRLQFSQSMMMV